MCPRQHSFFQKWLNPPTIQANLFETTAAAVWILSMVLVAALQPTDPFHATIQKWHQSMTREIRTAPGSFKLLFVGGATFVIPHGASLKGYCCGAASAFLRIHTPEVPLNKILA